MDLIVEVLGSLLTENGALVAFLLLTNIASLYAIKILWKRNETLSDKFVDSLKNNTEVMTKLLERLQNNHDKDNRRDD
jgi:hypothetical protein